VVLAKKKAHHRDRFVISKQGSMYRLQKNSEIKDNDPELGNR